MLYQEGLPGNNGFPVFQLLGTAVDYAGCVVLLKGKKFENSLPFWSLFFSIFALEFSFLLSFSFFLPCGLARVFPSQCTHNLEV
jgi:hypothetical protein